MTLYLDAYKVQWIVR